MNYRQILVLSGKGKAPHQFAEALRGVAVDGAGAVHAVGDQEVKVFDRDGKFLRRYATARPGYCLTVDADGTTYVGEAGQIETFDPAGKPLTTWQDEGRMGLVTTIRLTAKTILLADARKRCIRRYDRERKWLNDIGRDNNTKGFLIPNGHLDFTVDAGGTIHAVNPAKFRVERYAPDGKLLGRFGRFGARRVEDFPGCCNPTNLALTAKGNVVVTEKAGPRMKVFDPEGKMLAVVGHEAFDAGCKNMDVATDTRGRIYVADTVRLHICVFAPTRPDPAGKPADAGKTADSEGEASRGGRKP